MAGVEFRDLSEARRRVVYLAIAVLVLGALLLVEHRYVTRLHKTVDGYVIHEQSNTIVQLTLGADVRSRGLIEDIVRGPRYNAPLFGRSADLRETFERARVVSFGPEHWFLDSDPWLWSVVWLADHPHNRDDVLALVPAGCRALFEEKGGELDVFRADVVLAGRESKSAKELFTELFDESPAAQEPPKPPEVRELHDALVFVNNGGPLLESCRLGFWDPEESKPVNGGRLATDADLEAAQRELLEQVDLIDGE